MEIADQIKTRIQGTVVEMVDGAVTWAPKVLAGVILLVVGLVFAKIVRSLLRKLLERVYFDPLMAKIGVDKLFNRIGVSKSLSIVMSDACYYLLLLFLVQAFSDALGLIAVSKAVGAFFAYLPNVVAALVLVMFGAVAASAVGRAVTEAAKNSGIDFASSLGGISSALIFFVLTIMAVGQLQLETDMIFLVSACTLGALGLAFALSFGLGSRDITRNLLAGFYARRVFEIGAPIEIGGEKGRLQSITPTQVVMERDGELITVANSVFLEGVVKQNTAV